MSTISDQEVIDRVTRQSQIIVGALIAGVLFFLGIATVVDLRPNRPAPAGAAPGPPAAPGNGEGARAAEDQGEIGPVITYAAIAFAAVVLPLSFVVPGLVTKQNRRAIAAGTWAPQAPGGTPTPQINPETPQTDTGKLAMVYSTQLIIGAALNESAAFFAGVAYLVGKDPIALGLAFLLVGGLIARFPTSRRVQLWIDRQTENLILERHSDR
jgi:hypothetical protein